MISVEPVHTVLPVAAEWEALAERLSAGPFISPDWIEAHWRAFGAGQLVIIAVRRDGRLGAVLALARRGSTARSVTNAHTPGFGVLAEDDELTAHALAALADEGVSRISLSYVDREDPLVHAVREQALTRGRLLVERLMLRSPYIELAGKTDPGGDAKPSSAFKADLRRRNRRLAEQGAVQFDVYDGSRGLDELLIQAWELEAAGWKGQLGTAVAAHASTRNFYAEIARRAAPRGQLRLFFLRLAGAPIAFFFALEQRHVLYLLKGGFDPAQGRMSPSQLLLERVIEYSSAARLERIELLGADEPHKLAWTDHVRERVSVESFARSPARFVQWAAYAHGRPVALRIGLDRVLRRLRDRSRRAAETMRKVGRFTNSSRELH